MISSLHFSFGSSATEKPLEISLPPSVTIFLGPNNSGKSQALKDILHAAQTWANPQKKVISEINYEPVPEQAAQEFLESHQTKPIPGQNIYPGQKLIQFNEEIHSINVNNFIKSFQNPNIKDQISQENFSIFIRGNTLYIDGTSRINLLAPQSRGDLKHPRSLLARIFRDDEKRKIMRDIIFESTQLYLALDVSNGDQIQVRFGKTPPLDERSLGEENLHYMESSLSVEEVSDGVKAFSGIIINIHASKKRIILIDEPEAFLHPSLAFKLGKEISKGAMDEKKHIFAATHSAHFLMGAISSGATVNIIRLTYKNGTGTARLLPNAELRNLMNDPLLRSVGVLEGLFHESVIVGEADADRAFYQEINERLLAKNDPRGAPHAQFLNAQNKQTIPRIIGILRRLGIPAAAVVDIDVLKDGGKVWASYLEAAHIPEAEHQSYSTRRISILNLLQDSSADFKKDGGINTLKDQDLEAAKNLLQDLQKYGIFVVPNGELESWLSNLDICRTKSQWLQNIFSRMGSNPSSESYVTPTDGDVWDFIGAMSRWLKAPERKGIPK
ncbi:ATP-dependent endonuclease [Pannonibacter indicus]|uniref:ATP-dependent nuclease n=1 Tax=Pannonibacter indicus TaxID=466044 RepID=UPI0035AF5ABB